MATKDFGPLVVRDNAAILNAIRNDATLEYRNRVPAATRGDISKSMEALINYSPMWNEFVSGLMNRIGREIVRNKVWSNPLARFKQGLLGFGDTIEEVQIGLLQAHVYDHDRDALEGAIFGTELPDVQTNFHTINRENYYKISMKPEILRRAFLQEGGLASFVEQAMIAPTNSDSWDEFILTTQLFSEYERNGGFYKVQVPDLNVYGSTADDARLTLRKLRATADEMTFLSTKFNAAKMPTFANRDELVIFASPQFASAIDVEALSAAFNIDRATAHGTMITIPQDHFDNGVQAVLTTSDFFIMADTLIENRAMINPVTLATNYFFHHHEIISASRFVPAVAFTSEAVEVISIAPPAALTGVSDITFEESGRTQVAPGETVQMLADPVPATGSAGAVAWSLSGNKSARTSISNTGVLRVSPSETSTTLVVMATAYDSNDPDTEEFSKTLNVTVAGATSPVWPVPQPNTWVAEYVYALNEQVYLTAADGTEIIATATTAGTSGTTEPVGPAASGGTVTDGTVVWTRVTA